MLVPSAEPVNGYITFVRDQDHIIYGGLVLAALIRGKRRLGDSEHFGEFLLCFVHYGFPEVSETPSEYVSFVVR